MKKLLTITLLSLLTASSYSQTPSWQWIRTGGANGSIHSNSLNLRTKQIGTDAKGNIYGISSVSSAGIAIDTLTAQNGYGYDDFVVFSYTCDGKFRWIKKFGSVGDDVPGGIVVDKDGSVYVCGAVGISSWGDAHFADSVILATNAMLKGYFIEKLDSNGNVVYLNLPEPTIANAGAWPIRVEPDNKGNPVVLTWFSDSTTWNGHHVPSRGHYLVKFNKSDGSLSDIVELGYKHASNISGYSWTYFNLDKNDNSVYLYTAMKDSLFIGNDTLLSQTDSNILSVVIVKFSPNGNNVWYKQIVRRYNTANYQYVYGKPIVYGNKLFISGSTQSYSYSNFLGVPIVNPIANSPYKRTLIFASFNKHTGSLINVINLKNKDNIFYAPLEISDNNIISSSTSTLSIMNQNDTIKPFYYDPIYTRSYPFIVSMDTGLTHFNWGIATKTLQPNVGLVPTCLHVDHNSNILIGGGINGAICNSAGDTTNLVAAAENFCIAKVALTNDSCGCTASIPSLSLVGSTANTLTVNGYATNMPDSLYIIWGDGDSTLYNNPNTDISHTYSTSGPWNVCLKSYAFCGDKIICLNNLYSGIGNKLVMSNHQLVIYPNPFNQEIIIEFAQIPENAEVQLYDLMGKQILKSKISDTKTLLNTGLLQNGVYLIKVITDEGDVFVGKVVKSDL